MKFLSPTSGPAPSLSRLAAAFTRASHALLSYLRTQPLLSEEDQKRLSRHFAGIRAILSDLTKRRGLVTEGHTRGRPSPVSRESGDWSMLMMLRDRKIEITAYCGEMIAVAERLWLNGRMTDAKYEEFKKRYRELPKLHDELRGMMGRASDWR